MKKNIVYLLLFLMSMIFITACQPDPRKDAEAYATRSQADQQAADAEQARQIQADKHEDDMTDAAREQQIKEANKRTQIFVRNLVILTIGIFSCILIATFFIFSAKSYAISSVGVARAASQAAMVRANCIRLDPVTRQYPVFLQHLEGSKFALINPNVNSVLLLDVAHEPDRQMIATSGATQVAGVLASEASKTQDPAGMAMINPPIVHSQTEDITLGSDYLPSGKE